jgi:hypothetical protein
MHVSLHYYRITAFVSPSLVPFCIRSSRDAIGGNLTWNGEKPERSSDCHQFATRFYDAFHLRLA